KDLAAPKDGKPQTEVAKAWLDHAAKAEEIYRPAILLRVKFWYEKVKVSDLPAGEKLAADQRVNEINKQVAALGSITLARPGEPVTRRHFDSIRSATALESQWVVVNGDGFAADGVRLKNDASITSRFKIMDGCRLEFFFVPDGREVQI